MHIRERTLERSEQIVTFQETWNSILKILLSIKRMFCWKLGGFPKVNNRGKKRIK